MSRYSMLCKLYENDFHAFDNYRKECYDFYSDLILALRQYFEISSEKLQLLDPDDDNKPVGSVISAVFNEQDLCYHLKAILHVQIAENIFPKESIKFEILVKKPEINSRMFLVRLKNEQEFGIKHEKQNTRFQPFFDHLFKILCSIYDDQLNKVLTENINKINPVGFKIERLNR